MATSQINFVTPSSLYEDNDIIVVNKPADLLSVEDGYNQALPHLRAVLEPEYGDLWMVHRLDKETSGIVVLARNAEAHRVLNAAFRDREVEKIYHGLICPVPNWREKQIDFPLSVNADRKHRTRVDESNGKPALTACKVDKWFPTAVLMEIQIFTGITHQIRAHLRAFDFALIGDKLYAAGLPPQPIEAPRMMLHARKLSFAHPRLGTWLSFTAPYPDDFRKAYTQLKTTTFPDAAI